MNKKTESLILYLIFGYIGFELGNLISPHLMAYSDDQAVGIQWEWIVGPLITGGVILVGAFFVFKRHLTVDFPRLSENVDKLSQSVSELAVAVAGLSQKTDGHEYRLRRIEGQG